MAKNITKKVTSFSLAAIMVALNALGLSSCEKNEKQDYNSDEVKEPSKIVEQDEHKHIYQKKESIDLYTEKQTCECGKSINEDHNYNVIKEYIPSCDNNHLVNCTFICENCHNTFTTTKSEQCNFANWVYNKETGNYERTCVNCGYVDIKDHTHNWQILKKIDENYEYYACSECGAVKPFYHKWITKEIEDGLIYQECNNKQCNYIHIDSYHEHKFIFDSTYQDYDYYKCSCGEELAIEKDLEPTDSYTNNYCLVRKKK